MIKEKILICDDEKGVRDSLKLILSDAYELLFAEDGIEAMDAIKSMPGIKAVLLDIKMPKRSGLDILKDIKVFDAKLPVIIITGYQSVEAAREAVKYGASNYIVKPFESKDVLESLQKAVI